MNRHEREDSPQNFPQEKNDLILNALLKFKNVRHLLL